MAAAVPPAPAGGSSSSPAVGEFCATGSPSGHPSHSQRQNPALFVRLPVARGGRGQGLAAREREEILVHSALARHFKSLVSFRRGICFQVFVRFLLGLVWAHVQFLERDWRSHVVAGPPSGNREKALDYSFHVWEARNPGSWWVLTPGSDK